jgi:hypothetical protein
MMVAMTIAGVVPSAWIYIVPGCGPLGLVKESIQESERQLEIEARVAK